MQFSLIIAKKKAKSNCLQLSLFNSKLQQFYPFLSIPTTNSVKPLQDPGWTDSLLHSMAQPSWVCVPRTRILWAPLLAVIHTCAV